MRARGRRSGRSTRSGSRPACRSSEGPGCVARRSPARTVTCRSRTAVRPAVDAPRGRSAMAPSNSGDRPRCAASWRAFGPFSYVQSPAHSTPNSVKAASITDSNRLSDVLGPADLGGDAAERVRSRVRRSGRRRPVGRLVGDVDPWPGRRRARAVGIAPGTDACAPAARRGGSFGGRRGRGRRRLWLGSEDHRLSDRPFGCGRRGVSVGRCAQGWSTPYGSRAGAAIAHPYQGVRSDGVRGSRSAVSRPAGPPRSR